MNIELLNGDCLGILKWVADNSVDSIVTDPPYGLSFMGKKWDYDVPSVAIWREALRVLKPGGHLLSFGGTRTYHRMVVNIEDAGFEIRDQIAWLYGQGFPKSTNVLKSGLKQGLFCDCKPTPQRLRDGASFSDGNPSQSDTSKSGGSSSQRSQHSKQSDFKSRIIPGQSSTQNCGRCGKAFCEAGLGTALKPSIEPIVMARKPLAVGLTVAANVIKYGTGALNIDGSRIATDDKIASVTNQNIKGGAFKADNTEKERDTTYTQSTQGRWPANILLDEEAAAALDKQSGVTKSSAAKRNNKASENVAMTGANTGHISFGHSDSGGASRFFYVAKASKSERNLNCEEVLTWENADQNLQALTAELNQQLRATYVDTMRLLENTEWNTFLSGKNLTDQYLVDFKFTMSTATKLIIASKTSNYYPHSNIKESILDATRTLSANGLNLVEIVEHINQLKQSTTNAEMASALGVANVVLKTLLETKKLAKQGNVHSTVKPIKLMQYLIKLVTPPGGTVLDPFMGSGTTGVAAKRLGCKFIGIEKDKDYYKIAYFRIKEVIG